MKPLSEMTHYDVLDVSRSAENEAIERAYRLALATYADGGLGVYSVYGDDEVAAIRERIELAYRVLSDAEERQQYDLGFHSDEDPNDELPLNLSLERIDASSEPVPAIPEIPEVDGFDEVDEGSFDGPRLRRARLRRGIELEQVAQVTKINPTYLRFIEDERFDDLPASVYVRGFLTAYVRVLGMDPGDVVPTYMERFHEDRSALAAQRRDS